MSTERTRVLVTGGCGFLGSEIVSALLATNRYDITAVDINPPALGTTTFTQDVRYVRANVLDRDALQKTFDEAKPAMVVHTVGVYRLGTARYSMKNKEGEFTVNVEGTRNVLDASRECSAKGLVYTSSVTVVLDELGKDFKNVDETWPTGYAKTSYGQSKVGLNRASPRSRICLFFPDRSCCTISPPSCRVKPQDLQPVWVFDCHQDIEIRCFYSFKALSYTLYLPPEY